MAWLTTPSVRVNPSSQRASNGIDFFGSSWEFPTLEWRTLLRNSSAQRQLESLSPHGLGSLLDQWQQHRHLFTSADGLSR